MRRRIFMNQSKAMTEIIELLNNKEQRWAFIRFMKGGDLLQ